MIKKSKVCELLSIEYPIIQAPMHRIAGAELVAAVSNAGGLGVIGPNAGAKAIITDVVETGEHLRRQIRKAKSLTDKPFAVNIVILHQEEPYSDQCVKVALEERVPVAVLAGYSPEAYTKRFKDAGVKVFYRAMPVNNCEAAKKAEQAGIDAFIAVGFEGGGYLGDDRIPTFVLIPQIVDAIKIPVVAGGGIVDGRGMVAAMALGAEAIFLGTRFIATTECLAHESFKQAIVDATDTSTVTFTGIVGILRALKSPLVEHYVQREASGIATEEDRERLHRHGSLPWLAGDWTGGPFACGAGAGLIKEVKSAAEVVQSIVKEADQILKAMCY